MKGGWEHGWDIAAPHLVVHGVLAVAEGPLVRQPAAAVDSLQVGRGRNVRYRCQRRREGGVHTCACMLCCAAHI